MAPLPPFDGGAPLKHDVDQPHAVALPDDAQRRQAVHERRKRRLVAGAVVDARRVAK